ncbi:ABC transporter ATP-binding protein [Inquilinus limosus]|uniref:ABC transporter n=1 Tax=Inquilinus limosus TaxID=171674 RepID=A0A211ZF62_9PROT|nr:ABC transporter ATP-binding protein [Inquilinus limosus]OWJ63880.1 ABC transporter [Inquilinus limosus]
MTLVLEGVTRDVGAETHIHPLDLTLEPGTLTVLLGRTQAGKTTLMRLMAGLERPSRGRVLADGRDVTGTSVRNRDVAMVYQQFINYPSKTVYDNIASPLRLKGLGRAEIDRKVRETASMLRIDRFLERLPGELSGGQQQRTAIARALVKDAGLLLLDEPLVNLDYKLREELRAELSEIFRRGRSVVVYATTEPAEALILGGRTVVLDEGRLLQEGPTVEVFQRPASTKVAEVFSDPPMNIGPAEVADGALRLAGGVSVPLAGHLAGLAAGPCTIGLRPGHLRLGAAGPGEASVTAPVELAEISGSETYVHFHFGGRPWVAQQPGVQKYPLGEPVTVAVDPARIYVFDPAGRLAAAPARGR